MSAATPPPAAASAVIDPDVNVNAAVANASDDLNAKTPEPVQPPLVENVPAPSVAPTDGATGTDALAETVANLATTVTGLVASVGEIASAVAGLVAPDHAPNAVPWTHKGGAR